LIFGLYTRDNQQFSTPPLRVRVNKWKNFIRDLYARVVVGTVVHWWGRKKGFTFISNRGGDWDSPPESPTVPLESDFGHRRIHLVSTFAIESIACN
jgi:hypothetical protein